MEQKKRIYVNNEQVKKHSEALDYLLRNDEYIIMED